MTFEDPFRAAQGSAFTVRKRRPGERLPRGKCNAIGLRYGDCAQRAYDGERYCWYHSKIVAQLCDPFTDEYPAHLPAHPDGYVVVEAVIEEAS